MARNLWLEFVVDAYLQACADGRNWEEAVAEAERAIGNAPRRVLTREDLQTKKGIPYCRQYLSKKVREGTFPRPFQTPV
jgi:predicted anti-sigma-YlaC factor YlaD